MEIQTEDSKERKIRPRKSFIQKLVNNNLFNLEQDLSSMNPINRTLILDKLTKYLLAALTKKNKNNINNGDEKIQVEYVGENKSQ